MMTSRKNRKGMRAVHRSVGNVVSANSGSASQKNCYDSVNSRLTFRLLINQRNLQYLVVN